MRCRTHAYRVAPLRPGLLSPGRGVCVVLQVKEKYMACLKQNGNDSGKCMAVAKVYLECRMSK